MYGTTLRNIRVEKGLSQKEVCTNVVSLSYYSRIERNISEPTISVFFDLLSRLHVTCEEFLFIHRNYQHREEAITYNYLSELYQAGNITKLIKEKARLDMGKTPEETGLSEITSFFIARLTKTDPEANHTNILISKLMSIDNWTYIETKIFISIMDQFPIDTLLVIVNRLLKKKNLYSPLKGDGSLYNKILINTILLCIYWGYFKDALNYLSEYRNHLTASNFSGKTIYLYLDGMLKLCLGEKELGKQMVNKAFYVCQIIDSENLAEKYKLFFKDITKKYHL